MVRLNSNLRKTLRIALPMNGCEAVFARIDETKPDLEGFSEDEFLRYLTELEDMGLANVYAVYDVDGEVKDFSLYFNSDAASYFVDNKWEIAKTVGRYAFQLVVGASGGLVVLLLSQAF